MELDIARAAALAKLSLTPEEVERLREQVPAILEYVAQLQGLDVPMGDGLIAREQSCLRVDAVKTDAAARAAVIENFPASTAQCLRVPGVFS